jgi:hypothetical protein
MLGNEGGAHFVVSGRKQQWSFPMFTKTKLALAAALIFGAASAGQAANENDGGNETGGFHLGTMGQHFGGANPVYHRSMRHEYRYGSLRHEYRYDRGPFAFVPGYRRHWQWD